MVGFGSRQLGLRDASIGGGLGERSGGGGGGQAMGG